MKKKNVRNVKIDRNLKKNVCKRSIKTLLSVNYVQPDA